MPIKKSIKEKGVIFLKKINAKKKDFISYNNYDNEKVLYLFKNRKCCLYF